jgi:hypothetical protein
MVGRWWRATHCGWIDDAGTVDSDMGVTVIDDDGEELEQLAGWVPSIAALEYVQIVRVDDNARVKIVCKKCGAECYSSGLEVKGLVILAMLHMRKH